MKNLLMSRKKSFAKYIFACFLFIITDLAQAFMLAMIFNAIEVATMTYFYKTIAVCVGFILFSSGLFLTSRMLRIAFMRDVLLDVRVQAFDRVLDMSEKQYNRKSREVYLSNLTNDINTFENTFFITLLNFILRCGSFIAIITVLYIINWQIGLVITGVAFIMLGISRLYEKKTVRLQEEKSTENERFTVAVANTFNGLEILKLNNIEKKFLEKARAQVSTLEKKKAHYSFFTILQNRTNDAVGSFVMIGLLIFLMSSTGMTIGYGRLALIIQLASQAIFPLMQVFPFFNVLKSSDAIYRKITKKEESVDEVSTHPNEYIFHNKIAVDGLSFAYESKQVFRHVDFTIEKGKKYLLRGPSGAGKTTLIKLLSMAYDDYDGKIEVDGVDYKTIKTASLNKEVSYIYQDVFLFEASLYDNITLFKPIPKEKVEKVIELSGLSEFTKSLEDGLDTQIMENGKNLSGGERQRISIARALAKNADLLFIDEATASLNEELGRAIEETILDLKATVVAISHRYYEGISENYDYVLELIDGYITQYPAREYFQGVNAA
ncbi:MAG TPA: ABC transporter ATP-binding protein [Bacillota bacterium]|nr:ABC transporter ATP-binding protein [Bacillota bacterium]HPQ61926.1 ABC transporter ATP-binding protein [Bacillota bacterium]